MREVCLILVLAALQGCKTKKVQKEQADWLGRFGTTAPPGTIAVNDSLFCDRTEASNFYWLEYEYWVKTVMGQGSTVDSATGMDTTGWWQYTGAGNQYSYLRHPAYLDFPVVGVTYQQAITYSAWRSDRVMELMLIGAGIIEERTGQTADSRFTIEGFYATDSLKAYHHLPYPDYSLPTYEEWQIALNASDSLAMANLKECKGTKKADYVGPFFLYCADQVLGDRFVVNSIEQHDHRSPEHIVKTDCFNCPGNIIWHMRGNVAELSAVPTQVLGGAWSNTLDTILLDQPFPSNAPHFTTGFRNVCRWRKWTGARQ